VKQKPDIYLGRTNQEDLVDVMSRGKAEAVLSLCHLPRPGLLSSVVSSVATSAPALAVLPGCWVTVLSHQSSVSRIRINACSLCMRLPHPYEPT
jgi:hypothetical protein